MTWKQLIDDIELMLSRSKPSGDTELEKDWLMQQLLNAKRSLLPKYIYANKEVPQICLTAVQCQHVLEEKDCEDGCPKRQYLLIPTGYVLLEMTDDFGCWAVTFPNGKQIDRRFNYTHATLTSNLPIASAVEDFNWYRSGTKIYLRNGVNSANFPSFSKFTLALVLMESGTYDDMMTEQIAAPDDVIAAMKDYALGEAYKMFAGKSDINAQGQDDAGAPKGGGVTNG